MRNVIFTGLFVFVATSTVGFANPIADLLFGANSLRSGDIAEARVRVRSALATMKNWKGAAIEEAKQVTLNAQAILKGTGTFKFKHDAGIARLGLAHATLTDHFATKKNHKGSVLAASRYVAFGWIYSQAGLRTESFYASSYENLEIALDYLSEYSGDADLVKARNRINSALAALDNPNLTAGQITTAVVKNATAANRLIRNSKTYKDA